MNERTPNAENPTSTGPDCGRACGARWRLPLLLALVLATMLMARTTGLRQILSSGNGEPSAEATADTSVTSPTGQTVTLAIQFADGSEQHDYVAWRDGMTVENLLTAASRLPKGPQFAQRGSGESALLTDINGAANEGGSGRNWTYSVNGQEADRSFAIYQLQPGDRVLWTFTTRQ